MNNFKIYGNQPCNIVLVHGGPGARGSLTPLALGLSKQTSVLEAFQTKSSIDQLIEELHVGIQENTQGKITLIGHSWGAWLSLLFTEKYPENIEQIVLIGAAPFEESYAREISQIRMDRLENFDKHLFDRLLLQLNNKKDKHKNKTFKRLSQLILKADSFQPVQTENETTNCDYDQFCKIWPEASKLRKSGLLLERVAQVSCPVIAIHGNYDPHPLEGITAPLSQILNQFEYHLLEDCGHEPWNEQLASETFYDLLIQILNK